MNKGLDRAKLRDFSNFGRNQGSQRQSKAEFGWNLICKEAILAKGLDQGTTKPHLCRLAFDAWRSLIRLSCHNTSAKGTARRLTALANCCVLCALTRPIHFVSAKDDCREPKFGFAALGAIKTAHRLHRGIIKCARS